MLSMGAGLIDDFIGNILSVPFCPCHFIHTILSNAILSVYHFVRTILSVPFCPLPFCPRTDLALQSVIFLMLHYIMFSLTALTWHSAGVQYLFLNQLHYWIR